MLLAQAILTLRRVTFSFLFCLSLGWAAESPNPLDTLHFLEGTWTADAQGPGGTSVTGHYSFQLELNGHVLARHSSSDPNCKAPAKFDCAHGDLLYVFPDATGKSLKAIYFDNEGHVIHYDVHATSPTSVTLESEPGPGPRFRLVYELKSGIMTGKFQMQPPGSPDWRSYLEWTGKRE